MKGLDELLSSPKTNDSIIFLFAGLYIASIFANIFFTVDMTRFRLGLGAGVAGFAFGNSFSRLLFKKLFPKWNT